jgi:hypothetical protein
MPDYKRVLPPVDDKLLPSLTALEELGLAMEELLDEPLPEGCLNDNPLAGYTYFGQFIDHDITRDKTPLLDVEGKDPDTIENERSPWLDLDNLYGRNATLQEPWYDEKSPPEAKLFKLGKTARGQYRPDLLGGDELDLPRDSEKRAQLSDPRDVENLIVAQIHVLFLRFHNLAVGQVLDGSVNCAGLPLGSPFEKARRLVTWHYQRLVLEEFLPAVVSRKFLREIASQKPKFFIVPVGEPVFIPFEFSVAAFRFGHSMVRPSYRINDWQTEQHGGPRHVPLSELMACAHQNAPLPHDWLIDWTRFFEGMRHPSERETARAINPQVAPDLQHIPDCAIHLFTSAFSKKSEPESLPVRTLWRGRGLRLATGQQAAIQFGEKPLGRSKLNKTSDGRLLPCSEQICRLGMVDATPLWYYILWEAECRPYGGNRLSRVGGRIVAEVLTGLVKLDPTSYLNMPPQPWQSPEWLFPDKTKHWVKTFEDLLELLGGGLPPGHSAPVAPPLRKRISYRFKRLLIRYVRLIDALRGIFGMYS